ncbi:hypothetical protein M426DRAFT_318397, partial [Hypoxylon sp. CI-4A]
MHMRHRKLSAAKPVHIRNARPQHRFEGSAKAKRGKAPAPVKRNSDGDWGDSRSAGVTVKG